MEEENQGGGTYSGEMKSTKAKTFPETEQGKKPKSSHFRTNQREVLPVLEEWQQLGVLWSLSQVRAEQSRSRSGTDLRSLRRSRRGPGRRRHSRRSAMRDRPSPWLLQFSVAEDPIRDGGADLYRKSSCFCLPPRRCRLPGGPCHRGGDGRGSCEITATRGTAQG
jgi:hypothetical protein